MTSKDSRIQDMSPWSQTAWSFPGMVDRFLFGRCSGNKLAPQGIQRVVRRPRLRVVGQFGDEGSLDPQRQAAEIDVHEAWF